MMRTVYIFLILILLTIFLQVLEYHGYDTSYFGASPLNPSWDGVSELYSMIENSYSRVYVVQTWFDINIISTARSCSHRLLIVISPEKSYSIAELMLLKNIFRDGFSVLIADEGVYSSALMKELGIPVEIDSFNYIAVNGSAIFSTYVYLDNSSKAFKLWFAYASPIKYYKASLCRQIASVLNYTIGVECRDSSRDVETIVLGDGSIFTNSALAINSYYNPYRGFALSVIRKLTKGNITCIFLENSKYWTRAMTIAELSQSGVSVDDVIVSLLRPSRYLFSYFRDIDATIQTSPHIIAILSVLGFTTIAVLLYLTGLRVKRYRKTLERNTTKNRTYTWNTIEKICRYMKTCPKKCREQNIGRGMRKKCLNIVMNINTLTFEEKMELLNTVIHET